MGFWNPRARCPNCGGKIHTTLSGIVERTGTSCQFCGVPLTGKVRFGMAQLATAQVPAHVQNAPHGTAFCPSCYTQIYPGDTACEQGHALPPGWEQQLEATTGDKLRTRPAAKSQSPSKVESAHKDPTAELERLAALHASGALTDEEFSAAKARALSD